MFPQESLRVGCDDVSVGGMILAGCVEVHLVLHELSNGGSSLLFLLLALCYLLLGWLLLLFSNCTLKYVK
jgi:hypothetical protein